MIRMLCALLFISISNSASALECFGTNQVEGPSSGKPSQEELVLLQTVLEDPATLRMEADQGDSHFFVQMNKQSHEYMLIITRGPDYTQGVVSVVTWDQESEMRLSRVDGNLVSKLVCRPF